MININPRVTRSFYGFKTKVLLWRLKELKSLKGKAAFTAVAALFAALYFALTFAFAPISFLPLQVRVSDALLILSAVLGLPVVYGVFLGCLLANIFPVGYLPNPLDIVFGSLANLISSYLVYRVAYGRLSGVRVAAGAVLSAISVTLIVGSYLPFIILPEVSWSDVVWIGYLGVLPGELVAQLAIGVPLALALRKFFQKEV